MAILKPKQSNSLDFTMILFSVYSPPRSTKKSKLINYISMMYHRMKLKYPSAYFGLGGDINDLDISRVLSISPKFRQIVTLPTRKDKILSVIITDLSSHYDTPTILAPVDPDIPGVGKHSDHSTPFAKP